MMESKKVIFGIDIGLSGGISKGDAEIDMPTYDVMIKKPVYVQAKDKNGKKQFYKSGPNKGLVKMKIKRAAKYKKHLDVKYLYKSFLNAHTVVVEDQGTTIGNTAAATKTTSVNLGKLLACAEVAECKIVLVSAAKWKRDLGLSSDKLECVKRAEELSGRVFRTDRMALRDGPAEAFLIHYWYKNYGEDYEK